MRSVIRFRIETILYISCCIIIAFEYQEEKNENSSEMICYFLLLFYTFHFTHQWFVKQFLIQKQKWIIWSPLSLHLNLKNRLWKRAKQQPYKRKSLVWTSFNFPAFTKLVCSFTVIGKQFRNKKTFFRRIRLQICVFDHCKYSTNTGQCKSIFIIMSCIWQLVLLELCINGELCVLQEQSLWNQLIWCQ